MVQLPESLLRYLQDLPTRFPQIEKIVLFGSRSLGNGKPGSYVDLAFFGKELNASTLFQIHQELEDETTFPYFFDVVHGDELSHKPFKKHIQDHGNVVYPDTLTG